MIQIHFSSSLFSRFGCFVLGLFETNCHAHSLEFLLPPKMEVFDVRKIHLSIHAFHFVLVSILRFSFDSPFFFVWIHRNAMPRQTQNKCSNVNWFPSKSPFSCCFYFKRFFSSFFHFMFRFSLASRLGISYTNVQKGRQQYAWNTFVRVGTRWEIKSKWFQYIRISPSSFVLFSFFSK